MRDLEREADGMLATPGNWPVLGQYVLAHRLLDAYRDSEERLDRLATQVRMMLGDDCAGVNVGCQSVDEVEALITEAAHRHEHKPTDARSAALPEGRE